MPHALTPETLTGIVNGINFDGRFAIKGWKGIAFFLLGYAAEEALDEDGECFLTEDTTRVVAVMVGDDRRHVVPVDHLTEISEDAYCPDCGQIGCGHGR